MAASKRRMCVHCAVSDADRRHQKTDIEPQRHSARRRLMAHQQQKDCVTTSTVFTSAVKSSQVYVHYLPAQQIIMPVIIPFCLWSPLFTDYRNIGRFSSLPPFKFLDLLVFCFVSFARLIWRLHSS